MTHEEQAELLAMYERVLATNLANLVACRGDPETAKFVLKQRGGLLAKQRALSIREIDGVPVTPPGTEPAWRFLDRL